MLSDDPPELKKTLHRFRSIYDNYLAWRDDQNTALCLEFYCECGAQLELLKARNFEKKCILNYKPLKINF